MEDIKFNGFANVRYYKYIIEGTKKTMIDGKQTFTRDEIEKWPHSAGNDIPEDIVVLDCDDKVEGEILVKIIQDKQIKCYISPTTKGYHFYFRIPQGQKFGNWVRIGLPIGLSNFDFRSGQVTGNIIERREGKWVEWIVGPKYDENNKCFRLDSYDLDEIPFWLTPISKKTQMPSMLGLGDGEGRNNELFKHKCRLVTAGWDENQIFETFQIINTYIFDTPLDEKELRTVARFDENERRLQQNDWFSDKGAFLHNIMGDLLKDALYCYRDENDTVWYYDGEVYSNDDKIVERKAVELYPSIKDSQRKELIKYLALSKINTTIVPKENNNYVCVNNGLVDADTGHLTAFSPMYFVKNKIEVDYDPDAYDEHVDKFLNDVLVVKGDKEQRLAFEEYLGYTIVSKDNYMKKMAFMIGPNANNGKSTTLAMLQNLLTQKNYSAVKLCQISEANKFMLGRMANKLANFDDDADSSRISGDCMSYIKQIISNNPTIECDMKFKEPKLIKMNAKFFVASNHIIKTEQKGDEWMTRILIFAFDNQFNGSRKDPRIIDNLKTINAKKYLLRLALEGHRRLMKQGQFTESQTTKKWTEIYRRENDSLFRFLEHKKYTTDYLNNVPVKLVYEEYKAYLTMQENDQVKFARNITGLEKTILEWFRGDLISSDKDGVRVFMKAPEIEWFDKEIDNDNKEDNSSN